MRIRTVLGGCALVAVSVFGCCAGALTFESYQHRRVGALLKGDERVNITGLSIRSLRETTKLNDPESVAYLTRAFRAATYEGHSSKPHDDSNRTGPRAYGYLSMNGFAGASISFMFPNDETVDGVTVEVSLDGWDMVYFWVRLPYPRPSPVDRFIEETRAQDRERRPAHQK
jgi:hypothetical protein